MHDRGIIGFVGYNELGIYADRVLREVYELGCALASTSLYIATLIELQNETTKSFCQGIAERNGSLLGITHAQPTRYRLPDCVTPVITGDPRKTIAFTCDVLICTGNLAPRQEILDYRIGKQLTLMHCDSASQEWCVDKCPDRTDVVEKSSEVMNIISEILVT